MYSDNNNPSTIYVSRFISRRALNLVLEESISGLFMGGGYKPMGLMYALATRSIGVTVLDNEIPFLILISILLSEFHTEMEK